MSDIKNGKKTKNLDEQITQSVYLVSTSNNRNSTSVKSKNSKRRREELNLKNTLCIDIHEMIGAFDLEKKKEEDWIKRANKI